MATPDDVSTVEPQGDIKKVTVAGPYITGAIGASLVEALSSAGFELRALTRSTTSAILLPPKVEVIEVDYTHSEQLEAALLDQDVVISALGDTAGAVAAQEALIYASLALGVKRFVPSEFGSDTMNPRVRSFPFCTDRLRHQDLLIEAVRTISGFSYTIVITGPFLDWGLSVVPFIINVGTESAEVFDGRSVPFSTTRVSTLGKAIVSCLQPDKFTNTANHNMSSTATSFERKDIDTVNLEEQAWADYSNPNTDPVTWIFPFINLSIWSKEKLCCFERTDKGTLGISELQGAELEELRKAEIRKARKAPTAPASAKDDSTAIVDTTAAEKAFEEGKKRLDDS